MVGVNIFDENFGKNYRKTQFVYITIPTTGRRVRALTVIEFVDTGLGGCYCHKNISFYML